MPETVKRTVRITTRQDINEDVPPVQEGFPMRKWSIRVDLLSESGAVVPATVFDKVTYKLHPTFPNPTRPIKKVPFLIEEEGWGEFDLKITLHFAERGGETVLSHDLNFAENLYTSDHVVTFPTTKPGLLALLAESGPVPTVSAGSGGAPSSVGPAGAFPEKRTAAADVDDKTKVKKPRIAEKGSVDLEKLAAGLEKLSEEDILSVVQMVSDNKTPDMYVKNDAEAGEFHMDLYTLPDRLLKTLWEYVKKRTEA